MTGTRGFLKLGSFAFGFGAGKNDKSGCASLTAISVFSFFTGVAFELDALGAIATFFADGGAFADGNSTGLCFLSFESDRDGLALVHQYNELT